MTKEVEEDNVEALFDTYFRATEINLKRMVHSMLDVIEKQNGDVEASIPVINFAILDFALKSFLFINDSKEDLLVMVKDTIEDLLENDEDLLENREEKRQAANDDATPPDEAA